MSTRLIELELNASVNQSSESPRAFIDQLLLLLRDAIAGSDRAGTQHLRTEIDALRASLAKGEEAAAIVALGARCLDACREAISNLGTERLDHQREILSLLELVRKAIGCVVVGTDTLQVDLARSADRFQALALVEDPKELKTRLDAEVASLKHLAVDCRNAWQGTVSRLDQRVLVLEEQLQAISTEASIDPLTGVNNRRAFERACRTRMTSAGAQFVLAVLDVDKFKPINDTFGHSIGDRLLVYVARTLAASLRTEDLVARLGGDEFVVLAADLTPRVAETRMIKILATLTAQEELGDDKFPVNVTLSCGIAEFSAGDTVESLLKRADEALYDAKRSGRNRVVSKSAPFLRDLLKRRN